MQSGTEGEMYSKIVKWACLAALVLAAAVMLHGVPQILVQFVVCGGAIFVMIEAFRSQQYMWAAAFALVAAYFNPIVPFQVSRLASLSVQLACAAAFLASIRYVRPLPKMSLATITDLPARGESL
jgi:uncharacterized membrane protein YccC